MENQIKTPQTHPDHPVVGKHWATHSYKHKSTQIYFCESYDPAAGYNMTNINDPEDKHCISERAPWRTWYPAKDEGDHWMVEIWWKKVPKVTVKPA